MEETTITAMRNTALLTASIGEYWRRYFSNRSFPDNQEFYVVYTNLDHAIPFKPDPALNYWLINFKFLPAPVKLGNALPDESFNAIISAYLDIVSQGVAAFRQVPTIMPHFSARGGTAAQTAWSLLKPINCSPSLHTAAPFFLYNLGAKYFPEMEPELRRHIGEIVSTVIKSKYHAMIDIAFGLFLVRRIIEDKLALDFQTLESFFLQEQKTRDNIPYEHVFRMYREITELEKKMGGKGVPLPEIMESYFQEIGLPRVKGEKSNCFYDLDNKALVYPAELKVGKGLF